MSRFALAFNMVVGLAMIILMWVSYLIDRQMTLFFYLWVTATWIFYIVNLYELNDR